YISIPDDLPGDILILYQELFREENGLIYPRLFLKAFATIPEIPLYANRNRIKSIDTQGTYLREADVIYIGKEKDPLFLINRRNIGSKLDKKEERFQKSRKMVF
ncbi:MAG: hypothetical protein J7L43_01070, partial [Candidatus Aenigmarchaeota archaeon]|nr:hypothetical protein [Candidatus Aenigmarchaeota archaeon]